MTDRHHTWLHLSYSLPPL